MSAYRTYAQGGCFFSESVAIAEMLMENVLFSGEGYGEEVALYINFYDIFVPVADDEVLCSKDIEPLYVATCNPAPFSFERWAALRYKRLPMPEIVTAMREAGVWDKELSALELVGVE